MSARCPPAPTCSDAEKKAYEDKLKKDGDWD